jgi:diguanylate cyclase (GGDEF)-like protein
MPNVILIVDDDPQFRALVRPLLQQAGHSVLEAAKATDARALMAKTPPDLLVIDGLLPDTDGVSWIRKLRAEGVRTPIAFVSAFFRDLKSFHELTRELGVGIVLRKPIIPAVLLTQLESLMVASPKEESVEIEVAAEAPDPAVDLLEALRIEYQAKLPERLDLLEKVVRTWLAKPTHTEPHDAARKEAHKLRGTAGSYGFVEVGEAAGRIEDVLVACAGVRPPTEAQADTVDQALAQARHEAAPREELLRASPRDVMPPSSARVLVVDDDERFLAMCSEAGRAHGLAVTTASTAAGALAAAEATRPDAILLDVHLEGPSFGLTSQLRSLPGSRGVAFAFCSADDSLDSRIAAAHAGASLYLTKPVVADRFVQAMRELTTQRRALAPHVLVVDDDEAFCARIAAFLDHEGMRVRTLTDPSGILEALDERAPELVLLDIEMPGLSGLDLCRLMRTTPRWRTTPIIFLTAHTDVGRRLAGFEAGGDDYLVKPVVDPELVARLRVRLEHTRLLKDRAERDNLTGLLLRGPFVEQVAGRLAEAQRHDRPLALALEDLDKFKQINDTAGHLAGDRVLGGIGELLQRRFRLEDLRARWGGDEFALAFPGEAAPKAGALVERARAEFTQLPFRVREGEDPIFASLTAGIAAFPADGRTIEALLGVADRRLYAAKAAGRNCVFATDKAPVPQGAPSSIISLR